MDKLFGIIRLVAAMAVVAAIVGQFAYSAGQTAINPFNFFGYFTIQSNIIGLVAWAASARFILAGRAQPQWAIYLRALATTVLAIVGVVYNTLLANAGLNSFNLQWYNDILHIIIPIYAVLDWILLADRPRLPLRRLWLLLIYPIVWLAVMLVRGATDGFVPYPFLDPASGYGSVALYCVLIAVATVLVGAGVYWLGGLRTLSPRDAAQP
ncbi:Pr6Pr family membrane protein [Cryobacterium sp. PH31-L1]|uniref:Pr6Pr family membrane protein n=1 Tax=Cryobacterium sp. PH31-L1 TaxID=3046199 RepID=UPI0024BB9044|nr:Pr6Pr family membrane protein [Cryobacterium sp. PH31-L1]MDJ0378223.1 Pr6Pr family membrane protein [Cryobacterium sp. PH31-L1]